MIITQKLENEYKNCVNFIKKLPNGVERDLAIGALISDVGKRSFSAVSNAIGICFRKAKSCYEKYIYGMQIKLEFRGRKRVTEIYPELKADIELIIEEYLSTDPHFRTEKQFVKLTINEIMTSLIDTGKYKKNFIGKSTLANLLNEMGYNLKKVKRCEPLKKIEETDAIFDNVKGKKKEALIDNDTALISIDTKDKVLIGSYSREGSSRVEIKACDHELTNRCVIPFGILDLKTSQTYFFNFMNKPTSEAICNCIEDYIIQNQNYNKLCILLDNGPDNSGVRTAFLVGLVKIAKKYNKTIELIYYPPYHSKYNPVERIWARVENYWNGMLITSEDKCNKIMENITWKEVQAKVKFITKKYEKGVKYSKEEMLKFEGTNILRDERLKKWSIVITP